MVDGRADRTDNRPALNNPIRKLLIRHGDTIALI